VLPNKLGSLPKKKFVFVDSVALLSLFVFVNNPTNASIIKADTMRQAAIRARAKAEEEAAAWLQLAAQAKSKAEQDALLEQRIAEATRLRAQEEVRFPLREGEKKGCPTHMSQSSQALKLKEEAAVARRKAQDEVSISRAKHERENSFL